MKAIGLGIVLALVGCATVRPAQRAPAPQVCASECADELASCMGNTTEDERYSSCMPQHEECVTACYDVT